MRINMEYHWETVDAQGRVVQHAREPHIIYDAWVGGVLMWCWVAVLWRIGTNQSATLVRSQRYWR